MASILIVGSGREERELKAHALAQEYKISPFDRLIVEPENPAKHIGIEQIRMLRANLALRPFNSAYKIAILVDFEKATEEAQNAFLKTLEEPPSSTIIVLTSPNADLLLPTIVSRCQVIQLATTNYQLLTTELSTLGSQLSALLDGRVGDKLKLAQDLSKNRENLLAGIAKLIVFLHQKLLDQPKHSQYLNILISCQKAYALLTTTNVSPRLTLETHFLNLNSIR